MLDTFDTASDVDVSTDIGAPRQTGSLVPLGGISYTELAQNGGTLAAWECNSASGPNEPELVCYYNKNNAAHSAWQNQDETTLVGTKYNASVHMDLASSKAEWGYVGVSQTLGETGAYIPSTGAVGDIDAAGNWELYLGGSLAGSGNIGAG